MPDPTTPSSAETHLAIRLAHNDGHLIDDTDWERASRDFRSDYLALARTTLTVQGGPTETQQQAAVLAAEVRELRRQRDRYREAWLAACRGRARARAGRKP